jgi:membrane protein DedA with SNARE-associated domain
MILAERRRLGLALVLTPLALFFGAAMIGTALAPKLLVEKPLLLVALNPVLRHLVLAANDIPPIPFYVVALLRLLGPDPFHYLLGRLYGDAALAWVERRSPRAGRFVRWVEGLFERWGLLVLLVAPEGVVCLLAGAAGVHPITFVAVDVLGTLGMLALVRLFGSAFAVPIEIVVNLIQANAILLTGVSIAAVAFEAWRRRRRRRPPEPR